MWCKVIFNILILLKVGISDVIFSHVLKRDLDSIFTVGVINWLHIFGTL